MDVVILILSIVLLVGLASAMWGLGYRDGARAERKKHASLIEELFKSNNYLRNIVLNTVGRKLILVSTIKGKSGWHCHADELEGVDGFGRTREEAMDDYKESLENMLEETGAYKGVKLAIFFQPDK